MSSKLVVGVAGCALCLMFATAAGSVSPKPLADIIIRVTSTTPGHEVQVEGGYAYTPAGQSFHNVTERTPFELRQSANRLMGIFGTASAESPIHVEMVTEGKKSGHGVETATGKAVTVSVDEDQGGAAIIPL